MLGSLLTDIKSTYRYKTQIWTKQCHLDRVIEDMKYTPLTETISCYPLSSPSSSSRLFYAGWLWALSKTIIQFPMAAKAVLPHNHNSMQWNVNNGSVLKGIKLSWDGPFSLHHFTFLLPGNRFLEPARREQSRSGHECGPRGHETIATYNSGRREAEILSLMTLWSCTVGKNW